MEISGQILLSSLLSKWSKLPSQKQFLVDAADPANLWRKAAGGTILDGRIGAGQ